MCANARTRLALQSRPLSPRHNPTLLCLRGVSHCPSALLLPHEGFRHRDVVEPFGPITVVLLSVAPPLRPRHVLSDDVSSINPFSSQCVNRPVTARLYECLLFRRGISVSRSLSRSVFARRVSFQAAPNFRCLHLQSYIVHSCV
jgi:hypothetical protein